MPAGTHKVKPGPETALRIKYFNTILRGAGVDSTFIFNSSNIMRQKSIIWMMGDWCTWANSYGKTSNLRTDILLPTRVIPVNSVIGFKTGDDILLRTDRIYRRTFNDRNLDILVGAGYSFCERLILSM